MMSITEFDEDAMYSIFGSLVEWWMKKSKYSDSIADCNRKLIAASLAIYNQVRLELLPTPAKSHYTFNLRDVSKIVQVCDPSHSSRTCCFTEQGSLHFCIRRLICRFRLRSLQGLQSASDTLEDAYQLIRLWVHEVMRVFHDRLVDDSDREYLIKLVGTQCDEIFRVKLDKVLSNPKPAASAPATPEAIWFCCFFRP